MVAFLKLCRKEKLLTLKSRLSTRVDIVLRAIKQIIHIFIQDTVFFWVERA